MYVFQRVFVFNRLHRTVKSWLHQNMWIWHETFSCEVDVNVPAGPGARRRHQTLAGHAAERAGLDGRNHQGGCQSKGLELNTVRRVTKTTRRQIRLAIWKEFNYFAPSVSFSERVWLIAAARLTCAIEYIKGLTLRSEDRLIRIRIRSCWFRVCTARYPP